MYIAKADNKAPVRVPIFDFDKGSIYIANIIENMSRA